MKENEKLDQENRDLEGKLNDLAQSTQKDKENEIMQIIEDVSKINENVANYKPGERVEGDQPSSSWLKNLNDTIDLKLAALSEALTDKDK